MITIRRLTCFDYSKLKRLISYLSDGEGDNSARSFAGNSISLVNAVLPLKFKFKPESFILVEDNEILGMITAAKTPGNPYKINITKLVFKENRYDIGQKLVEFLLQKYGSKGALSFMVTIDECHTELFNLFINACGFRQCASEILWKIEHPQPQKSCLKCRYAQNSDSKNIASLYNDELIGMYKPSLLRNSSEFREPFFGGMSNYYKTRYVIENGNNIAVYYSITTSDNLNYIIDFTINSAYDVDYAEIVNRALCEIASKRRAFYPIIKLKNYVKNSDNLKEYLTSKNYIPIQTQQILVKDYYKPVHAESGEWKVFSLGENQITSS